MLLAFRWLAAVRLEDLQPLASRPTEASKAAVWNISTAAVQFAQDVRMGQIDPGLPLAADTST
jgi:hypothetical protein